VEENPNDYQPSDLILVAGEIEHRPTRLTSDFDCCSGWQSSDGAEQNLCPERREAGIDLISFPLQSSFPAAKGIDGKQRGGYDSSTGINIVINGVWEWVDPL